MKEEVMIPNTNNNVFFNNSICLCRYEKNGKYYVVDNTYNRIEVSKETYMKLHLPIREVKERFKR